MKRNEEAGECIEVVCGRLHAKDVHHVFVSGVGPVVFQTAAVKRAWTLQPILKLDYQIIFFSC